MKVLRFGAAYLASPIFNPDIDNMGHLEPSELKIPDALARDIEAWDREFQETFSHDYPP